MKAITFTPSKNVAQQLEEISRISGFMPNEIITDIVSFEIGNMFRSDFDANDNLDGLRRYLYRHDYSREQAAKVAANYNAFALREAKRSGRPVTNAALVESNPNAHGSFRIWFPLLTSGVEKIARQAQRALKSASVLVS
jgi:hypothetical protein